MRAVSGPVLAERRTDRPAVTLVLTVRDRRSHVIARIWRGWTTPENADAYQRIVSQEVLPGIAARNLDGYHGAYLLRRRLDDEVEFATILLFDSLEQVRAFAGDDYEAAYVPPRARAVLARFDQRSAHYDTLLRP
jgi:heme-degrading monooxygenase HmoA